MVLFKNNITIDNINILINISWILPFNCTS